MADGTGSTWRERLFLEQRSPWRVVTVAQLEAEGVSWRRRQALVAAGELEPAGPGVLIVGPACTGPERWWQQAAARLLSAGPDAVLIGRAAAAVWGLDGFEIGNEPLSVDVPSSSGRRAGVRRIRALEPGRTCRGLAVTAPAQTLLDLGAFVADGLDRGRGLRPLGAADVVELALEAALRAGLVQLDDVERLLIQAGRSRRGRRVVAEVLGRRPPGAPPTESYLETRGIQVLRDAGLVGFERQVWVHLGRAGRRVRVDLFCDGRVIEFDGRDPHAEHHTRDRRRWNALADENVPLRIFTWDDVEHNPLGLVTSVRRLLDEPPSADLRVSRAAA